MSRIYIQYPCADHPKEIIAARVTELLHKLEDKYGIAHEFTCDDQCDLTGSGINGQLKIDDDGIEIDAKLGFMMMAFKAMIETEIKTKLDETFSE